MIGSTATHPPVPFYLSTSSSAKRPQRPAVKSSHIPPNEKCHPSHTQQCQSKRTTHCDECCQVDVCTLLMIDRPLGTGQNLVS